MKKWTFLLCLAAALPALAADDQPTPKAKDKARRPPAEAFTDPAKAGPGYEVQGEYAGELGSGKVGVQVVAEGDGQFTVRGLRGGLPGDGWNGRGQLTFAAKTENGKTAFTNDHGQGEIGDGKITLTTTSGDKVEFKRVVRHSPTEGAKPPAGAVVLFDGTTADPWDNGKIENGLLSVAVPRGQTSKQKFGDCTLHAEFILPFMPKARGQARANSGVYVAGCYEVQVLDSFALEGKDNECGGIYQQAAPLVNMCYPPLQWQTYDIDFTAPRFGTGGTKTANARLTVKHNGVVIHDNLELKHATPGGVAKEGATGPIHLQNHGNPVYFRNIWVVEKK
jgi:hypothetical protein